MSDESFVKRSILVFAAIVLTYTIATLGMVLLILLTGCAHRQAAPPNVVQVKIVEMPPRPNCYIAPAPEAPPEIEIDFEREDVVDRAFIHIAQYRPMRDWAADMGHWVSSVEQCLEKLQGAE